MTQMLRPELEAALRELKPGRLRQLVLQSAADDALLLRLLLALTDDDALPPLLRWRLRWAALVRSKPLAAEQLQHTMRHLTELAAALMEQANYADAWLLIRYVLQQPLPPAVQQVVRSEIRQLVGNTLRALVRQVGMDMQQAMYDFFSELLQRQYQWTSDLLAALLELLLQLSQSLGTAEHTSTLLMQLRRRNRNAAGQVLDEQEEETLLMAQYRLLKQANQTEAADMLLREHGTLPAFARLLVRRHLAAGNTDAAESCIRQVLQRRPADLQWHALLLETALQRRDAMAIRKQARHLFLESGYDLRYYRLLRQTYAPARWPRQAELLVKRLRERHDYSTRGIHVAARIWHEEEKRPEQLVELLRKNCSLDMVRRYASWLQHNHPEVLLQLYAKALRRYAESHKGAEAYATIVETLEAMLQLPGSPALVRALIIELKVSYRQRRALVRLLNKLVI